MRRRTTRWLAALALAAAFGLGMMGGGSHPPIARGEEPTPTPTATPIGTNGEPGGSGGGH